MRRGTARAIHATVALLVATGGALLWMVLLSVPPQPTADQSFEVFEFFAQHPWQPTATNLHILTGPALVFLVGLVWSSHVWTRLRNSTPTRRRTGLLLSVLFPALVLSGYSLQIATAETTRSVLGWTHAILGIAFGATYVGHRCLRPKPVTVATSSR